MMKLRKNDLDAFSFIEIGLCLLIVGVVTLSLMPLLNHASSVFLKKDVEFKQQKIVESLSAYTARHSRLPGASTPSDKGLSVYQKYIGIVPYQTLGLDEKMVKDKKGNWFTYAVMPALTDTQDPNESDELLGESNFCTIEKAPTTLSISNYTIPKGDLVAFVIIHHNNGNGAFDDNLHRNFRLKDQSKKSICEQQNVSDMNIFCTEPSGDTLFWITRNNFSAQYLKTLCKKEKVIADIKSPPLDEVNKDINNNGHETITQYAPFDDNSQFN
jgi:hypothetical protein